MAKPRVSLLFTVKDSHHLCACIIVLQSNIVVVVCCGLKNGEDFTLVSCPETLV